MMEINLVKYDGKAGEKIIELVDRFFPKRIRKKAEAEAYAFVTMERAKADAESYSMISKAESLDRINDRMLARELKRQNNIDSVVEIALNEFQHETSVSDENVSEDWGTRFFNIVEDISDSDMQLFWGKILAGEVKSPNSYSLRTLEVFRNLSSAEAKTFHKLAQVALNWGGRMMIFANEENDFLKNKCDITFSDIMLMKEVGIISSIENLGITFEFKLDKPSLLLYNNIGIEVTAKKKQVEVIIKNYAFTTVGRELIKLVQQEINFDYLKYVETLFKSASLEVVIGKVKNVEGKTVIENLFNIPD